MFNSEEIKLWQDFWLGIFSVPTVALYIIRRSLGTVVSVPIASTIYFEGRN